MSRVAEIFDEGFLLRLTEISQSKTWVKESFFDQNSVPVRILWKLELHSCTAILSVCRSASVGIFWKLD